MNTIPFQVPVPFRNAARLGAILFALCAAASSRADDSAGAQFTSTSLGGGKFKYTVTLENTGTTNLETFWFAWTPGENFMPVSPTGVKSPAGWTANIEMGGNGYSIQWLTSSEATPAPLTPDSSLVFSFESTIKPAAMAGESSVEPGIPMTTSFVYAGAPLSDSGDEFSAEITPGPIGFLPSPEIVSTTASNGDVNPYGVAFVPNGFSSRGGPLKPGDILVSNFNNSSNLQGTGTTIVRIPADGDTSTFFATPNAIAGGTGTGLSTALAVLRKGYILAGSVPSVDGSIATARPGSLLVIDGSGALLSVIADPSINGPWDMTVDDQGDAATAYVSNVFAGTVVRLDLKVTSIGVTLQKATVIASGYGHQGDPAAFADGPTGLVYNAGADILYVASTLDNAVYAVKDARKITSSAGTGTLIYADPAHLHGPLGMEMAPNGDLMAANNDVVNADSAQPSEIVEFTVDGQFVKELSVDPAPGGSFGLNVRVTGHVATFAAVDDNTPSLLIWSLGLP